MKKFAQKYQLRKINLQQLRNATTAPVDQKQDVTANLVDGVGLERKQLLEEGDTDVTTHVTSPVGSENNLRPQCDNVHDALGGSSDASQSGAVLHPSHLAGGIDARFLPSKPRESLVLGNESPFGNIRMDDSRLGLQKASELSLRCFTCAAVCSYLLNMCFNQWYAGRNLASINDDVRAVAGRTHVSALPLRCCLSPSPAVHILHSLVNRALASERRRSCIGSIRRLAPEDVKGFVPVGANGGVICDERNDSGTSNRCGTGRRSECTAVICGTEVQVPLFDVEGEGLASSISNVYPHRIAAYLLKLYDECRAPNDHNRKRLRTETQKERGNHTAPVEHMRRPVARNPGKDDSDIEWILNAPSVKSQQLARDDNELKSLLGPTMRQQLLARGFKNKRSSFRDICEFGTREECYEAQRGKDSNAYDQQSCEKVHFRRIIVKGLTDVSLGDCSYLDTCRNIEKCKFVHYELENKDFCSAARDDPNDPFAIGGVCDTEVFRAQWIRCDIRTFDMSIFKSHVQVVMADPPWDIHMDLPYGTLTDSEMRSLRVDLIQDEGLLFLWVTGRAMELARECLQLWGYQRVEEILWIKTNQLQRIIRTGRTGHWLNHSKEHCIVGIKGTPKINRNIDCDIIVSEVRETSRKPDEIYRIIERMCPGSLKVELFGRMHNVRNNWITLGNQLKGVQLNHPELMARYNQFAAKTGCAQVGQEVAVGGTGNEDTPTKSN